MSHKTISASGVYIDCIGNGYRRATVDHVVPRSYGGTNAITNLVAACRECNQQRGKQQNNTFTKLAEKHAHERQSKINKHYETNILPQDIWIID